MNEKANSGEGKFWAVEPESIVGYQKNKKYIFEEVSENGRITQIQQIALINRLL